MQQRAIVFLATAVVYQGCAAHSEIAENPPAVPSTNVAESLEHGRTDAFRDLRVASTDLQTFRDAVKQLTSTNPRESTRCFLRAFRELSGVSLNQDYHFDYDQNGGIVEAFWVYNNERDGLYFEVIDLVLAVPAEHSLPDLVAELRTGTETSRSFAALLLGELGRRATSAISDLEEAAVGSSQHVALCAADAIERIQTEETLPAPSNGMDSADYFYQQYDFQDADAEE